MSKMNSLKQRVLFMQRVNTVLQWAEDQIAGEMIDRSAPTTDHYTKEYLSFSADIWQEDLDAIVKVVNATLEHTGTSFRVYNSMGEIRPGWINPQLNLPIQVI
jgi:hypothetical protein